MITFARNLLSLPCLQLRSGPKALAVLTTVLMMCGFLAAQSQGSTEHKFDNNGGSVPTGATVELPLNPTPPSDTFIEVTKIEEQDATGKWHDITSAFKIDDNKTKKVTLKKNNGEISLAGRKIKVHWKTNNTITDVTVKTTY